MNIMFIDDIRANATLVQRSLTEIDSAIKVFSCSTVDEALMKSIGGMAAPEVIFFNYRPLDPAVLNFLRVISKRQWNPFMFCLVSARISEDDINAFSALGVHCFLDRQEFFKRPKEILKIIFKTLFTIKGQA